MANAGEPPNSSVREPCELRAAGHPCARAYAKKPPHRSAWSSSSWPAWALKKITGILGLVCFRHRCSCKPSRFGMRTSRIRQEASVARPEFSKSAPEKNASPRMPNERMSLQVELATEASSSTTITSVDSLAFALSVPAFRRAATAHSEREPLTLNRHSNYNASSAADRAADV